MTLSLPEDELVRLFHIPIVRCDEARIIISGNEAFCALFDISAPMRIDDLSDDFNERRFLRKIERDQSYLCRVTSGDLRPIPFWLELTKCEAGYIGFLTDASAITKAEAMMASYSAMIEKQNKEIIDKTEQLAKWSTRIKQELEQAKTVQDLLVPNHIELPGLRSRCQPLRELSGDFHEVARHEDGRLTFICGDVAGKVIYAAILLAQTLTAFRSHYEAETLSALASRIVTAVEDRFPDGLFVALTLVRLSEDRTIAEVLNLGNPEAVVVDEGGIAQTLPAKGPAIGILPAIIYEGLVADIITLTGRRLYVFSDGIIDLNLGPQTRFADGNDANLYIAEMDKAHGTQMLDEVIASAGAYVQSDDIMSACLVKDECQEGRTPSYPPLTLC